MPLELSALKKSRLALADLLKISEDREFMERLEIVAQNGIRAGVVQNFEITYELAWKLMKKWLQVHVGSHVADGITRQELFRLAAENQLIFDVKVWMRYHNARNDTSHIYDEERVNIVYQITREFSHDVTRLIEALEARNDD